MDALCDEDFKKTYIGPKWSNLTNCLLEVVKVARKKMKKSRSLKSRSKVIEKKSYGDSTGYLKVSMKKKRSGRVERISINGGGLKKKRQTKQEIGGKNRAVNVVLPHSPPSLPEGVKDHIVEKMGGSDLVMVIQKKLFFSDVNPSASRLSIPFSKLETHEFLTESEAKLLSKKEKGKDGIKVFLLEPSMELTEVKLNKWDMNNNSMYVIKTAWNSVVKNNGLEEDDVVQLWSFRVNSALCFALLKL